MKIENRNVIIYIYGIVKLYYKESYMHKLIILRGNSGSGKTTVSKELQKKFGKNTMYISQDMVRRQILMVDDGNDTMALSLMKEMLSYGSRNSEVVILEGIMYADWYRTLFVQAKELYRDNIYAYYFDIPFEETVRRHQMRDKCNEFGAEAMRKWWREKDYSDVLDERIIGQEYDKNSIVNKIYCDVMGV